MSQRPSIKLLFDQPYDAAQWHAASGDHLHVRIGNAPATIDRPTSLQSIQTLMDNIEEFGAEYCDLVTTTSATYVETDIRFKDQKYRRRSIPCAIIARFAKGQLVDLRIYLDPSPIPGYRQLELAPLQYRDGNGPQQ